MFKGSSDAVQFYPGVEAFPIKSGGLYYGSGERFICGMSEGTVGEWDIVGPNGNTLIRGWKRILRDVVKAGYATKGAVERIFQCSIGEPGLEAICQRRCGCKYERGVACRHGEAGKGTTGQTQEALRKELESLPGITQAEIDEFDSNGRTIATVVAEVR